MQFSALSLTLSLPRLAEAQGRAGPVFGGGTRHRVTRFVAMPCAAELQAPRPLAAQILRHDYVERACFGRGELARWKWTSAHHRSSKKALKPSALPRRISVCQGNLSAYRLSVRPVAWLSRSSLYPRFTAYSVTVRMGAYLIYRCLAPATTQAPEFYPQCLHFFRFSPTNKTFQIVARPLALRAAFAA